jgi:UDP-MurNAc hydroxylase
MKLKFLSSACVIVQHKDVSILCDPWLVDGEYFGSWAHYPKFEFNPKDFEKIDFIYISHQHPDHFSPKTLSKINKNIPILIHNYHFKFLKKQIESLGFQVIELNHNDRFHLKNGLYINILAADNCEPELCYKFFGCGIKEKPTGSTYNDTMCVIDNNDEVIVNTNDCPFPLAERTAKIIKSQYTKINLLLVGYNSAGPYPQCFNFKSDKINEEKKRVTKKFFQYAENYVKLLDPNFFLPFAGRYVLAGKNSVLNNNRATVELEDAYNYFINSKNFEQENNKCFLLNSNATFDLETKKSDQKYIPVNTEEKNNYIKNVLSKIKYDYEQDDFPDANEIKNLFEISHKKFQHARHELQFKSTTKLLIQIPEDLYVVISLENENYEIIQKDDLHKFNKFVKIDLDSRLLKLLLQGPQYANWNNCEVGSHLKFERKPEIYESGLFYCLNFFHI